MPVKPTFMRFAFVLGLLLLALVLHAQPDNVFVDEQLNDPEMSVKIDASQLAKARLAKTSRPAELDPEGNWGKPSDGLQLSIRLNKSEYTNGEPIVVTTIVRNICWTRRTFSYGRQEIVVRDADGKPLQTKSKLYEILSKIGRGPDRDTYVHPQRQWLRTTTLSTNLDFPTNTEISVQLIQHLPVSIRNVSNVVESAAAKFRIVQATPEAKNASSNDGHTVQ